jgi:hypothetical protein
LLLPCRESQGIGHCYPDIGHVRTLGVRGHPWDIPKTRLLPAR